MLFFICTVLVNACNKCKIQIHLMLFFIGAGRSGIKTYLLIQIHLMLFFILDRILKVLYLFTFKYISCYSLSCLTTSILNSVTNSNTSHVILYQRRTAESRWCFRTFKYISCYSLSYLLLYSRYM